MRRVISCAVVCALIAVLTACGGGNSSPAPTTGHPISTTFSLTENPISEGNTWYNGGADGLDWSNVRTANGNAIGTQTNGGFNDSIAFLKGTWHADQTAQATVYANGPSGNYFPEVELFLRGNISPHSATGYEINFSAASGQYQQIVRWNGPLGNFTNLSNINLPSPLASGDVVKATIVGNVITVYKNGIQVAQVTDNTYSSGSPGIGFFHFASGDGQDALWGFMDFSASD